MSSDIEEDHIDAYSEELDETDSGDEASDSDASISSFSSSELLDESFQPMPEHLTLPLELQQHVLGQETSQFHLMWGTYRFVSKAWKAHIEHLAKKEWIATGAFAYQGYMVRYLKDGKVFLNGFFDFVRLDGDMAVFQDDCAPEYHKMFVAACKATAPPDVQVCGFVHDVEILDMKIDWKTLTITCPWRTLIGRILAEELRVEAYRKRTNRRMMTQVKRLRTDGIEKFREAIHLYANHVHGAYEAVRTARLGRRDRAGDERLKHARVDASWRLLAREEEEEEDIESDEESEENEEASEDSEELSNDDSDTDGQSGVYHLNLNVQSEDSEA